LGNIMKALAITCYAGAVLLVIDVLRIGTVVRPGNAAFRTTIYHRAIFDNISIQYLVIVGLIGLGTYLLTKKKGGE